MKTLITLTIALVTLFSCAKKVDTRPIKYRFIHGDTGNEIYGYHSLGKFMEEKKAWRLDVETGECVPYWPHAFKK